MWIVELEFTEAPERLAARPAHREVLTGRHEAGVVRMAGPFAGDGGALIVLDLPARSDVEAFLAADPYYGTPGVTVARVREWTPFLT
ncbi:YciI family protein [Dactylosporangium salmoneum]|uniref:YCII-related domain-containing protein n=1 Tax=Dactylosporangium salmoneum TaxID=53361 RepID=A0ABN3I8J5_9ACTN